MSVNLHQKPRAHFLHIRRTGGTAIKCALEPHLAAGCYAIHLHPHGATLAQIPEGEKVFFFLREPETRFVSGFYSRWRQGRPRYDIPWTSGEAEAFCRFPVANELARALSSGDPRLRERAISAMKAIGHIRSSFYHWFMDDDYFQKRLGDILFIGFQEQLVGDFEILKGLLQLPKEIALPRDEITAHVGPPEIDRSLDLEARANLAAWYAEDRKFLDYCRDIRRRGALSNGTPAGVGKV